MCGAQEEMKASSNSVIWCVTVATHSPEVSTFAVLCQDICARSLEVQHAAVEGAIVRVSEGNAGGRAGKAARTAQAGDDGGRFILTACAHRFSYTGSVWTSRTQAPDSKTLMRNASC